MFVFESGLGNVRIMMLKGEAGENAFQYAQKGGYTGTEAQFTAAMGDSATAAQAAAASAAAAESSAKSASTYYGGRELASVFADEIADYDNIWEWIQARITAGDFTGIYVGDYILFNTTTGTPFRAKIAGINTYKNSGDTAIGNHIDFITETPWGTDVPMNPANFNNGLSDNQFPWLCSNAYFYCNSLAGTVPNGTTVNPATQEVDYTSGGIYYYLPDELKAVISEKRVYLPKRYSASAVAKSDTGGEMVNIGKLWIPAEMEVCGCGVWGNSPYSTMGFVQYPLFKNNMARVLGRANWWTLTALDGEYLYFSGVSGHGYLSRFSASSGRKLPICFRVAAKTLTGLAMAPITQLGTEKMIDTVSEDVSE